MTANKLLLAGSAATLMLGACIGISGVETWLARFGNSDAARLMLCLLYTSDAADDLLCVDLGGRRIMKKKKKHKLPSTKSHNNCTTVACIMP